MTVSLQYFLILAFTLQNSHLTRTDQSLNLGFALASPSIGSPYIQNMSLIIIISSIPCNFLIALCNLFALQNPLCTMVDQGPTDTSNSRRYRLHLWESNLPPSSFFMSLEPQFSHNLRMFHNERIGLTLLKFWMEVQ